MIKNPFTASFFAGNRQKLLDELPENAVVVITAHRMMQQASDAGYPFWQEPNFYYLTGINEPDWRLILDKNKNQARLVAPQMSLAKITFDGSLSPEDAKKISGAEKVINQKQFGSWLKKIAASGQPVYTLLPQTRLGRFMRMALNPAQRLLVRQLQAYGVASKDCRQTLARIRAIKQKPEIAAIQAAIDITNESLRALMLAKDSFTYEFEFEAFLTSEFRRRGAEGHAFAPVVASGKNACTLHYVKNNQKIHKNDWLLLDVGARVHGYAADITRSFPVNTSAQWQNDIFQAAEAVHDGAMEVLKPGASPADYVHEVDTLMIDALKNLGLIKRRSHREMHKYFPHSIGHGLGIDVHDNLGRFETFQENMVITVEPGIYVPEKSFGVRLENDMLITKDGAKNLSKNLPNKLEEIK